MTKYSATGPFTNGTSPGISATFLNNVETFLGYAADTNITTDGSGNLTVASIAFTHGTLTRIAYGFSAVTTGGTTITHNLGVTPSAVLTTTSASAVTCFVNSSMTSTTFTATVSTNNNIWWLAIA
jgi:hypothetical protein